MAMPFHHPLTNLLAQSGIVIFSGLAGFFLLGYYAAGRRRGMMIGVSSALAFMLAVRLRQQFGYLVYIHQFATSLTLSLLGCIALARWRRGWVRPLLAVVCFSAGALGQSFAGVRFGPADSLATICWLIRPPSSIDWMLLSCSGAGDGDSSDRRMRLPRADRPLAPASKPWCSIIRASIGLPCLVSPPAFWSAWQSRNIARSTRRATRFSERHQARRRLSGARTRRRHAAQDHGEGGAEAHKGGQESSHRCLQGDILADRATHVHLALLPATSRRFLLRSTGRAQAAGHAKARLAKPRGWDHACRARISS